MIVNRKHPPSAGYDEDLTVKLTVSLHETWDEECVICMELTNTSQGDLEMITHSLPWRGLYSVVLVPTDTIPAGTPMSHPAIIDDPPFDVTTIKPDQSLSGQVRLAWRFPALVAMLKAREMILFWAYQPTTVNQTRGKWVGGWLLLPMLPKA